MWISAFNLFCKRWMIKVWLTVLDSNQAGRHQYTIISKHTPCKGNGTAHHSIAINIAKVQFGKNRSYLAQWQNDSPHKVHPSKILRTAAVSSNGQALLIYRAAPAPGENFVFCSLHNINRKNTDLCCPCCNSYQRKIENHNLYSPEYCSPKYCHPPQYWSPPLLLHLKKIGNHWF